MDMRHDYMRHVKVYIRTYVCAPEYVYCARCSRCATPFHACRRLRALLTPSEQKVEPELLRVIEERAGEEQDLALDQTGTGVEIFGSRLRLGVRLETLESNGLWSNS